jgi:uncharacterized protein YkwD
MCTVAALTATLVLLAITGTADARLTKRDRAERNMAAAINAVRAQHGLAAFDRSSSLSGSAERYSNWLMANDVFGHQSSIRASSRFALLGEALEMHSGRRFDVRGTIARWMGSPTHRAILLSPVMRRQGAGVTRGRFGRGRATIWVLHVGRLSMPGAELPHVQVP